MSLTIEMIAAMKNALDAIDPSFITKIVIFRELEDHMPLDKAAKAVDAIYDTYLHDELTCDLVTFTNSVAYNISDFEQTEACVKWLSLRHIEPGDE